MKIRDTIRKIFSFGSFACDLQETVDKLNKSIESISNEINELYSQDNEISEMLNQLNGRLTSIEQRYNKIRSIRGIEKINKNQMIKRERRKCPREIVSLKTTYDNDDLQIVDMGIYNSGLLCNHRLSVNQEIPILLSHDNITENIILSVKRAAPANAQDTGYQFFYGGEILERKLTYQ